VITRSPTLPRAEQPELGRLDPSQALLVGGAASSGPLPTARTVKALLEAAFSTASPDRRIGDEARARLLAGCLPAATASRWRTGLGLEPPAVLVPDAVVEAEQLLRRLPAREPLDLTGLRALVPAEVVDLVCTVAALRVALAAAAPASAPALAA
jgi:hypothetical protein